MKLPRLDASTRALFESTLPSDPRIQVRTMFGGLGGFVNGNMFSGALGDRIFLRLADAERQTLLKEPGGGPFEPMKGHAMAEYATVPEAWARQPEKLREWMQRSLEWVASLPPKVAKKQRASKK